MTKSLEEIFGNQTSKPNQVNQTQANPLDQIFSSPAPTTPVIPSPSFQMRSAHKPTQLPSGPNYGAAWARGTLGSVPGKLLTPLAEKITGRKFDINTLPEPKTFGEKALGMVGHLGADLPLWIGGEMAVAKPLSMLAKTAPISKGLGMLPKAVKPALNTGVKAGATYGGVVAPAETLVNRDGLQGLVEREKQVPLMALGGTALHGAGQLALKGAKTGIDYAKFNKLTKLPEAPTVNPLADVQNAYRSPSLRDAKAREFANPLPLPKQGTQPLRQMDLQQSINNATGVKTPLTPVQRHRVMNNLQRTFAREKPMEPKRFVPEPLPQRIWTNKDGIEGLAGQKPIRSITPENLGQLPKSPQARPREITTDIEMPLVNGRADVASATEKPRVMSATMESADVVSSELPRSGRDQLRNEQTLPGDDGTIRPQIDRNPKKRRSFKEIIKDIRTQFVDDVAPLEKMERSVTGGLASAEKSIYKQARLFRGSPEQAAEFVRSKFSPVMKSVEKQGKSVEDIGDYALAIHARDVNAKGINSGFSNERIANTIAKHGTLEMEAARKELMKINNDLLDSLAEAGVIEGSLVTALRQKHPNYMPLFRSFDDEKIEFASGLSKALANVNSPIKKLVGSDRDAIDPIESMIKNIYQTISAIDRNKVAAQLGRLADKDESGKIVRRLAEGEEKSRLNTVFAMENGKKVSYEVQPDVYKAIMGLDKESSLMLVKVLQQPASLLRAGATLTPEFSLRNPIRDIPTAFSVSKSGLNPVTDIPRALFDIIRSRQGKDTMYNQFLKDNAGYGNIISTDRKVLQDAMTDVLKESSGKKFVNIVSGKSLMRVLRSIADVSESATKLGEYRAALRSGATRPEAAYRARDIMDFARAGASVREANKIVAFLNASVQGKSKIYRAIKENPAGVTTRAFTSITLPTIGAFIAQKYLANDKQKAIIDDAADWMTSTFWLMPIPGTDQVARIPKPFDLAPIFANLPERSLKYIYDNDPDAFEGFAKQTMASMALPTMITGLVPFIEGMANYSFFRQGPIIPQRESNLNLTDQYDTKTTETAKFLAKGMNRLTGGEGSLKNFSSPRIMDNTIKGATAGLGTYATSAIDFIAETTGIVDKKNKPARNVSELPLLRAFLTSEKSGGKSMDKLYREKDRLTKEKGSAKLNNEPFAQGRRLAKLNAIASDISDITKRIRNIESDRSISPQTKRERINALTTKRNELAKKAK